MVAIHLSLQHARRSPRHMPRSSALSDAGHWAWRPCASGAGAAASAQLAARRPDAADIGLTRAEANPGQQAVLEGVMSMLTPTAMH